MSNKKEAPVRWLVDKLFSDNEIFGVPEGLLDHALKMEAKKQQKYDEMLGMLGKHLIFHNAEMEGLQQPSSEMWFDLYEKTEQLVKEAKEL
jgi:hypothetical protein